MLKKYSIIFLIAVTVVLLAACGSKSNTFSPNWQPVGGGSQSRPSGGFDQESGFIGEDPTEAETSNTVAVSEPQGSSSAYEDIPVTTMPEEDPTENTQATDSAGTEPDPTEPEETTQPSASRELSFEEYQALSASEQFAYAQSFPTMQDYIAWYNAAKEEAERKDVIDVTGPIDLGDL